MRFSLTTWNINSVRLRIDIVAKFLKSARPDVLCLQETKCIDDAFPLKRFKRLGYEHVALNGQKGYHGVATVSRIPLREFSRHDWQDNGEARHVGVELLGPDAAGAQGIVLENVYIPAGGDIPDREANPKFGQKLDFLGRMTSFDFEVTPFVTVASFQRDADSQRLQPAPECQIMLLCQNLCWCHDCSLIAAPDRSQHCTCGDGRFS